MATVRLQIRRGTASQWTSANPILAAGEMGVETDTRKIKIGDGTTGWTSLNYIAADNPEISEIAQDAIDAALVAGTGIVKSYNDGTNTITVSVDTSVIATKAELAEVAQDSIDQALTAGTGITKNYNDATNTLTVSVDTGVISTVEYVDDEISNLSSNLNNTIDDYIPLSQKGTATGVATLDANTLVPLSQLTNATDYTDTHNNTTTNVHGITDTSVLVTTTGNQTLTSKTLTSPNLTGTPTAPTANSGTDTTQIATTAFVQDAIESVVGSAPAALNTLAEIAASLDNDADLAGTLTSSISTKVSKSGDTMTGVLNMGTNKITDLATATSNYDAANKFYVDQRSMADVGAHDSSTTNVHGIANTANLVYINDSRLSDTRTPTDDSVTTAKILNSNVTTEKIADDAIVESKIADSAVTTAKIGDTNVTTAKLADDAVTTDKITDLNVTTAKLADDAVTTAKITDLNVTTAKIADVSVTTAKLADDSVTTAKLVNSAVTTAKIGDDNVTTAKLAAGAVTTDKITDLNVTTAKLADDAVTTAKITDLNVTTAKLASDAVTTAKVADDAVTTVKIADDAVTTVKIADNTVTTDKLVNNAVTTLKITDLNVTTGKIADSAITAAKLDSNSVTTIKILDANITTSKINDAAVTADKLATNSVTTGKIADGAVTSGKIADGTIVNADINSSAAIDQSKVANLTSDLALKATLASPTFTGTVVLPSTTSVGNVSSTELGYLDGVTSAIQTQIDAKLASATAASTYAPIASPTFTGTVSGVSKSMVGLGNVDNTSDANKPVSTATQTALDAKLSLSGGTMTGALTLSGAPTQDAHAATKAYVDNVTAGINFHQPVRVATTGNITLSGTQTIDGVAVIAGDRVLVKDQTTQTQNGIYVVASGSWTRATDADNTPDGELKGGDFTLVLEGTVNSGYGYVCSNTSAITIGTTNVTYAAFNAAKAVTAGTGLTESTPGTLAVDSSTVQYRVSGVSDTEIGYLDGVTSAIQTQLDAKAPIANPTFTGTVTVAASGVAFTDGTQTKAGVPSLTTIGTTIGAAYNLSTGGLALRDQLIPVSGTYAITVPANATTAYPVGTSISFYQSAGTGANFVEASGVTILRTPGLKLRTTYSSATLTKVAADTWLLAGDLSA